MRLAQTGSSWRRVLGTGGCHSWDVGIKSWRSLAARIANRNLSESEWRQYVGPDVPYRRALVERPPSASSPNAETGGEPMLPAQVPTNSVDTHMSLGFMLLRQNNLNAAVTEYGQAIAEALDLQRFPPDSIEAKMTKSMLNLSAGRKEEAVLELQQMAAPSPTLHWRTPTWATRSLARESWPRRLPSSARPCVDA